MHKRANALIISLVFFAILGVFLILLEIFDGGIVTKKINRIFLVKTVKSDEKTLNIIYPSVFDELSPLSFESTNRSIVSNIFEGLVKFDPYFDIVGALASKWGILDDDLTWEFTLKNNLYFSDGSGLRFSDIVNTFDYIKKSQNNDLKAFIANIEKIEAIDELTLHFKLKNKDPFFLSKLTTIYVFKQEDGNFIGSGQYYLKSKKNNEVLLTKNKNFHDIEAYFDNIDFKSITDGDERIKFLEQNAATILVGLPTTYSDALISKYGVQVSSFPSLENYFLGFDTSKSVFKDKNLRKAVSLALDRTQIEAIGGGLLASSSQFAMSGIFGFNPDIKVESQDFESADKYFKKVESFKRITVNLDIPDGLQEIGDYIKNELYRIGFDVKLNFLTNDEILTKIFEGKSEFYLLGFKHELGDLSDFYINMVHSKKDDFGYYNPGTYVNSKVDKMIEDCLKEKDKKKVQDDFQQIMKQIVIDDPFGVPLFNTKILYGISSDLDFQPRYDGYVVGEEVKMKN